ncbi:hypothetical protein ACET3X_003667 [Alternaria dauci]|uniref:Gpi anchored protein n=1 Tax=Alternaria dauci TaxID=48095 RepID=A0ABR3UTK6_9PLEO
MHFQKLAIVFALSAIGLAQDVDNDDIPTQCRDVCASVVTLTRDCDNRNNDDLAERQCVCSAQNANTIIPLCAACVIQNGGELDNDVSDVVRDCSFTSTSYNPTAASTAPPAVASGTSVASSVTSLVSVTSAASNASSAAPTASVSRTVSGTSAASNAASATSGTGGAGGAQQTTNAAPAPTMAAAAIGLGGVLGIAGLLL